jgi:hypothetical protein
VTAKSNDMPKLNLIVMLGITVLLVMPSRAQAAWPGLKKLEHGFVTLASAPLEIPIQTRLYWKEGAKKTPHILVWIFCGAVKGAVNMVVKVGSGFYDVVTFPIPFPHRY